MTGLGRLPARWPPLLALTLLASLLVAAEHYVVHQVALRLHPALLPAAVAFDLLVLLPGLFYWLGVRRGQLSASLLVAAVGAGLALSRWLLGAALPLLVWVGWAAQGLEALALGYTALRLRRVVRAYRVARQQSPYFLENLQAALAPTLGGLAPLLAHGLAVRCRPVLVSATHLTVRVGFVWWVRFPKNQLIGCKAIADAPPAAPGLLNVARPLLAPPNVLLTLAGPQMARGVLGQARVVRRLALYVDEPAALVCALQ